MKLLVSKTLSLLLLVLSFQLHAQEIQNDTKKKTDSSKTKKIDFNVMPFLSYDRNLEFMFGAIPMMMYKLDENDTISPKSLSGVAGVYTTNKSYFVVLFNQLYFKEDNWRATIFAGIGNLNSQFFMQGFESLGFYDYATDATILNIGVKRKIIQKLYGGLTYTYAQFDTEFEDDIQPATSNHTNALELNVLYDTRDAVYYPTTGINSRIRYITYPEWLDNSINAQKLLTEYNTYFSSRKDKDVIAARFYGQFGIGDLVFEQQVAIGGKDIRGYSEGKYRGDGLMALQGEYRYNFRDNMGLVGFAALATIYGSDNEDFDWKAYPGVGVGYRYAAFKNVKFNIGLDAAVGKDDWGIYFRIGEAF